MQFIKTLYLSLCLTGITGGPVIAKDLYVSPDGSDTNPGTLEQPLATMAGARDAIRALPSDKRNEDIHVFFRGGTYRLDETVVFSLRDGAPEAAKITYQAYGDEVPVFTSGIPVTGWKKLRSYPKGLPKAARGHIWTAPIPDGAGRSLTMYDGERRLSRARGEGFDPIQLTGSDSQLRNKLNFPDGAIKDWPDLKDAELLVVPQNWTMNILPLESVDMENHIATTAISGTYPLNPAKRVSPSAYVENIIDLLDSPGEWVVSTRLGKIFYWPEDGEPGSGIVVPGLKEYIRVEGKIDYDGPEDVPVRNLVFKGLTFMHGERDLWEKDEHLGWGIQHDFEYFDRSSAMVRFRGAERCSIEECRFTSSGGTAMRFDLYAQEIIVTGNLVEHMGLAGILFCGYGPGTKDVNKRNGIINNHIHDVGELIWHGHGIILWQSGDNRVSNNLIHHSPRKGICISGVRYESFTMDQDNKTECQKTIRWAEIDTNLLATHNWQDMIPFLHATDNVIEYNELHHLLEKLTDGTVINISGAGKGNIVRRNYIHHIYNQEAGVMRQDGWQMGSHLVENVMYLTPPLMHKSHMHIENNFIVNPVRPEFLGFQGFPYEDEMPKPETGSRIMFNVLYTSNGEPEYYQTRVWTFNQTTFPEHCWSDYNLFFNVSDPGQSVERLTYWQEKGIDKHSIAADPMFLDIENGDFRFKPGSPALKLGVKQIDVQETGLLDSFPEKFR